MNILHSSRTDVWFTPLDILVLAKQVLGPIGLDPASQAEANLRVGAQHYFTEEMDGLVQDWNGYGALFINAPGGKRKGRSVTELFWSKLMATDDFDHAIFLAFSLEAIKTTQRDGNGGCGRFPFCAPRQRIDFDNVYGQPQGSPSHSNMIVYIPGKLDHTEQFLETFAPIGLVRR